MALNNFTTDLNNHQSQPDRPTISASDLKILFDKAANDTQDFINDELVANIYDKGEVDSAIAAAEVGQSQKASQAEAEAGIVDDKWMTPLKTKQSIDENSPESPMNSYTDSTSEVVTDHIAYNVQTGKNITLVDGNRCLWKADEDSDKAYIQGSSLTLNGIDEYRESQPDTGQFTTNDEMIVKFNLAVLTSTVKTLITKRDLTYTATNIPKGWWLETSSTNVLRLRGYQSNGGATLTITGTTSLSTSTDYWAKIEYDGTNVNLLISTDGVIFTSEGTTTSQVMIDAIEINDDSETQVGRVWSGGAGFVSYFNGTIASITKNGTQIDYLETLIGTPTLLVDSTATTDITVKDGGNIIKDNYYESIYDGATWLTTEMPQSIPSPSNLVAEATLSGSSVTISDLDINADGGEYIIVINDMECSVSTERMEMLVNGDTTNTNYYSRYTLYGVDQHVSSNDARVSEIVSGAQNYTVINMSTSNNRAIAFYEDNRIDASNVTGRSGIWGNIGTTNTNITSITLKTTSGTFTSGTVKIYKRS